MQTLLERLGWTRRWTAEWQELDDPGLEPGRVAAVERGALGLIGMDQAEGLTWATHPPSLRLDEVHPELATPTIGDWVACRRHPHGARVEAILARRSSFVRKRAGRTSAPQLIAANVDRLLIVTAVGEDFSARRLERYLAAAHAGGVDPIIVLNKCDRPHDENRVMAEIRAVAGGIDVVRTSALSKGGVGGLEQLVEQGSTLAAVGSSGVGKSSIINRLLGEERLAIGETRAGDDTGKHVTTRRLLMLAPHFVIIDTPGMRELGLWDAQEGLLAAFADVETHAAECRFRDCTHRHEPGCRVQEAVREGRLEEARVDAFVALELESATQANRSHARAADNTKKRWKTIHRDMNERRKLQRKWGLKEI
ncbi:MAG: ribosome small subunit-dependent GTPase A [Deltaproteobacteria bacterium]|nr:ribosome small subunit-dependent GTPase A [Deltaproteobacteria bacterium]